MTDKPDEKQKRKPPVAHMPLEFILDKNSGNVAPNMPFRQFTVINNSGVDLYLSTSELGGAPTRKYIVTTGKTFNSPHFMFERLFYAYASAPTQPYALLYTSPRAYATPGMTP